MFDIKSAHVTLEGDSVVMFQQTARDIFKHLARVISGRPAKRDFRYLNDINTIVGEKLANTDVTDIEVLLNIIKASLLYQIIKTSKALKHNENISYQTKWNKLYLLDIVKCSKLHSVYQTALINYEEIMVSNLSEGLQSNLMTLCKIYACDSLLRYSEEALINNYIGSDILFKVESYMYDLFADIRPHLAAMIEGAHIEGRDYFSVLASEDGKVYVSSLF